MKKGNKIVLLCTQANADEQLFQTGSHEVWGSIPLGSTNNFEGLRAVRRLPVTVLCARGVPLRRLRWAHVTLDFSDAYSIH